MNTIKLRLVYLFSLSVFISVLPVQAAQQTMPAGVKITLTDELGPLYVTAEGFTLYTWRKDDIANESKCNNQRYAKISGQGQNPGYLPDAKTRPSCQQAWPPLAATEADAAIGHWATFKRHDGSLQWSYKGKPVYTASYDQQPGQITGLGNSFYSRNPLFAELDLPMGMAGRLTAQGYTLTNSEGFTLYAQVDAELDCDKQCEQHWRPHFAPALLERVNEQWSTEARADGRRQWLRDGQRLYTFHRDLQPGQLNGSSSSAGSAAFYPVILYPRVEPPVAITEQMTSEGKVFADKNGKTLYVWTCVDESPDNLPCDTPDASQVYRLGICGGPAKCMETWQPVPADNDAAPVGHTWTVVEIDPTGRQQYSPHDQSVEPLKVWAYQGRPVYTYNGDKVPGDIVGHGIRSFVVWGFKMIRSDVPG